jgi:hypothetical protein
MRATRPSSALAKAQRSWLLSPDEISDVESQTSALGGRRRRRVDSRKMRA